MRIAVLADIHGNLPAFEAALAHARWESPDLLVIAGDIVFGAPDSADCWHLAQSLGCPLLRGNHERYVTDYGTPAASPSWSTEQFAPLHWAVAQITDADRAAMRDLPLLLRPPGTSDLLIVHASARSDSDNIAAHTPAADFAPMFADASERFIVRAHNHLQQVNLWGTRTIITSGSIGLAQDGYPTAQYVLLDQRDGQWYFQHKSVPYDQEAALARFRDTCYVEKTGPIGRLFLREVVTASQQIVPFLRAYTNWSVTEPTLSLETALERFLTTY